MSDQNIENHEINNAALMAGTGNAVDANGGVAVGVAGLNPIVMNSVSVGYGSNTYSVNSVAVGPFNQAVGTASVVVGSSISSNEDNSVVVGNKKNSLRITDGGIQVKRGEKENFIATEEYVDNAMANMIRRVYQKCGICDVERWCLQIDPTSPAYIMCPQCIFDPLLEKVAANHYKTLLIRAKK